MRAKLRFLRVSARKTRLVADLVRGKGVAEAINILTFTRRAAASLCASSSRVQSRMLSQVRLTLTACSYRRSLLMKAQPCVDSVHERWVAQLELTSGRATSMSCSPSGTRSRLWDRRHIPLGFVWASSELGAPSGTKRSDTLIGSTKTSSCDALSRSASTTQDLKDRDRADGDKGEDQHLHRATWCCDR